MPDIRQLQRFVAVATERNFRRAAARLHVSQPPLSDSIRQLEEEIGSPLLLRTRRHVELTRAGEVFLERARLILSQLDESVRLTRAVAEGLSGQLTVGFFPTATYDILPRIVRRYRAQYPDIGLRFIELATAEQPAALEQSRIDVALFLAPTVDRKGLAQEAILREPLLAALPDDHRLVSRKRIDLRDLSNEPFVFIPPRWGTGYHARVFHACQEAGFTPNVIEEVEQLHTMVSLVGAGLGVSIVAASVSRFRPPNVVFRALKDSSLYIEFGLAWRGDEQSPAITAFLDIAREVAMISQELP
ncbi:MAG: LysR family transcriptional regulator [Alphaproteobacteria bacterium]|nr:LysR family transcriptional regulator [Alphaproteobacteria bacterium]